MTRKELAIAIGKAEAKKMGKGLDTVKAIAKGLLFGAGYSKPAKKDYLENWYNRLVEEGYINAIR